MSSDVTDTTRYMGMTLRTLLENSDLLQMPVPRNFVKDGPKKEGNWDESFDATAAFLGPTLWDKTVPYSDEFKMEYMDLDEFLCDNGINVPPTSDMSGDKQHHHQRTVPMNTVAPPIVLEKSLPSPTTPSPQPYQKPMVVKQALAPGPGQEGFDPRAHAFSEDELKPQPMIKKSKKQFDKLTHEEKIRESCTSSKFVPEDLKDDKYWARRRKNNLAAKRSRDARRIKENQIALRASFLEKENNSLKKEADNLRSENIALKEKLSKYEHC